MSVLIDISHPAHVHFFRPIIEALREKGVTVHVVARDKDVTVDLLESSGLEYEVVPMAPPGGLLASAGELVRRSLALRARIRQHRVRVVLTRNPSGAIAAFGTRTRSIFDTDDGRSVGIHYWAARPFADIITSSVHDPENHGRGHRRYRAIKAQMFLHPDRFTPDPEVRRRYLSDDERLAVVRFSAHDASHDRSISGISPSGRESILRRLSDFGAVLVSIEREGLQIWRGAGPSLHRQTVQPQHFHQLLAQSSIFVGDSQSVAAEAAVLGIPALRLSGFTGRTFYLSLLEDQGLIRNFSPGAESSLLDELELHLSEHEARLRWATEASRELNRATVDLPTWFASLAEECLSAPSRIGSNLR